MVGRIERLVMPRLRRTNQVAILHLIRTVEERSGRVSWTLRYRDPENRPMKMSLGEWPVVSLQQAQEVAQDTRFKPGLDPIVSARAPRRETANTVEKMVRL